MIAFKPNYYLDESPASFLTRISDGIGHNNVIDMMRVRSDIKCYRDLSAVLSVPNRYKRLMESIGIKDGYPSPVAENPGPGYKYRVYEGFNLVYSHFHGDLAAFCPHCLRSKNYWRKRWSLRMYTVCEHHGCELINKCQKCNLCLSIARCSIHICPECEFDFRRSKTSRVNKSTQQVIQRIFGDEINPEGFEIMRSIFISVDAVFRELKTDASKMDITRLIMESAGGADIQLCRILAETSFNTHPRIQLIPLLMNRHSASLVEAALKKLRIANKASPKKWSATYLTLSETCKALNVSQKVLKRLIGWNILSFVDDKNSKRIPSDSLIGLLEKTPEELRELIDKASGNDAREFRYVSGAQAAELLGVNETIVWGLVTARHLQRSVQMVGGYKRNTIDRKSIDHFKSKYITPGVIAQRFGVPKQNVSQRLRTLKIYPVSGPSINGAITNVFKISDVAPLTKSIVQSAKVCSVKSLSAGRPKINKADYISMKSAAELLGVGIPAVTKLTREKILNRVNLPHQRVLIEKKSVYKLIKKINDPNYVSLQEARQSTGIDVTPFWHHFVNTGIVKVIQLYSWQLIHKRCLKKINDLLTKYVIETEGNKMLGKGPKGLTSLRRAGKIEFKKIKGKRREVYFYSIESIENLRRAKFAED
ncbi:TniQ family protein [Cellvibrio sp. ARAG 10.3]|uniref:TniQ family protein n=1 Tax=Cellvibrio sp. ARAG 10.3 TaxID=3451358 RepID=UPI003F44B855